ncbi:hypothetical protein AXE65_10805 [Ventosimonas gracilis]|uniref:Uncharacterized protein n=1 Tax=Ventosimonas gracilis TaxID=1680762 RepID=A0A139SWP1_9GAMM|nr:hypothetical protein [Ventosimonas gracilis]KXU39008.1 hypothetical protein AXE65_10805 [Ventosimonas gracilis]
MKYLTREQAIQEAGLEAVVQAEQYNAYDYWWDKTTNTYLFAGEAKGYSAEFDCPVTVYAIYEQDYDVVMAEEDLSNLDWEIAYYLVK